MKTLALENFFVSGLGSSYLKLITKVHFDAGEKILDLSNGEKLEGPNRISIDLGDSHISHPIAKYVNHSCKPNANVCHITKSLVAITTVRPGDEITFNYLESERQITTPFDCSCGSSECVSRVE